MELGGISTMVLSHRDDVADHARFAERFGCMRWMHADDGAARYGVETIVKGNDPVRIDGDLLLIPTPGHTRGHMVLLYREKFLFTGDHLAWDPDLETLTAFGDACWYSWTHQTSSMERLLDYRFEWVLPGHGRIGHDSAGAMHRHLERCVAWMKSMGTGGRGQGTGKE
jgi:glyoxylase-like metal-dependent hydrolase (beta-lactamase superfamily II)